MKPVLLFWVRISTQIREPITTIGALNLAYLTTGVLCLHDSGILIKIIIGINIISPKPLYNLQDNLILMKNHFSVLLILLLLLLAGQANASFWFKVTEVTPIVMTPHSEANFTVSVKGLGSERAYVELVFKNQTEGIDFICPKMIKNVYPTGVTQYNCSVKAADVPPGNYSFVVDVAATGSPSGKKTAFINVVAAKSPAAIEPREQSIPTGPALQAYNGNGNQTPAKEPPAQKTPASGAVTAILAMLLVFWKTKS